jgi:tetratricopeptide (TPR) repeat protein
MRNLTILSARTVFQRLAAARLAPATLTLCAALLLTSACQTQYEQGMDALAEGKHEDAEKLARAGLADDPQSPEYNLLLAKSYTERQQWRQAEAPAKLAYDSTTMDGPAGRLLGKIYWELGRPIDAVDAWRRARVANPTSVSDQDFITALSYALTSAEGFQDFVRAQTLREELKQVAPADASDDVKRQISEEAFRVGREELARAHVRERRPEDALKVYEALIAEYPDRAPLYHEQRGIILLASGAEELAAAAFLKYAAAPDAAEHVRRLRQVAQRAEKSGARGMAIDMYTLALKEQTKPSAERAEDMRRLAGLLMAVGDKDGARTQIFEYIAEMKRVFGEPLRDNIYTAAADLMRTVQEGQLAAEILEQAMEEAPPSLMITERLAEFYARRARTGDVERVLRRYVERNKDSALAYEQVARWAQRRRSWDIALFFYEKLVQKPGVGSTEWYTLASIYAAQGRADQLRGALDRYIKLSKGGKSELLRAADLYAEQRMFEDAERLLKQAQKESPQDWALVERMAQLYEDWGRPQAISQLFDRWLKVKGETYDNLRGVGEHFLRRRRGDEALAYLKRASEKASPEQSFIWLQIADIYLQQRREGDMHRALLKYLGTGARPVDMLDQALQRYTNSGLVEETVALLEELIAIDPRKTTYYERLSDLYLRQRRDQDALGVWRRYIKSAKRPLDALQTISRVLERQGRQDWVLAFYQDLLISGEADAKLYMLIGNAFMSLHQQQQARGLVGEGGSEPARRAEQFYERYLKEASLSAGELEGFANEMSQRAMWRLVDEALVRLAKLRADESAELPTHVLLRHAIALLKLGDGERAEGLLNNYYTRMNQTPEIANTIAALLMEAHRYAAAEPYLLKMMRSGTQAHTRRAFESLAQIYRQSDRMDKLRTLVADYLLASQNPAEARRNIAAALTAAGMWDMLVEQYEQMRRTRGDEFQYAIGDALIRAGRPEQAEQALRDYASNNVSAEEAWLKVASLYELHGMHKQARAAYDAAVAAAPEKWRPHEERGRFRILQGQLDEGGQDMERAILKAPSERRDATYRAWVEALEAVGRYERARQVSREALAIPGVEKEPYLRMIAAGEFASGDTLRAERMVEELRQAGLSLDSLTDLIVRHGQIEPAIKILEDELAQGDYLTAGALIMQNAETFSRIHGIDGLLRMIQPLLDRPREDARLEGQLGSYLAREGHPERAAIYLRAAVESGELEHRGQLAHTYLLLGQDAQALQLFQEELLATPAPLRSLRLRLTLARYRLSPASQRLREVVEHLCRDRRFVAAALPELVRLMVESGEVLPAINLVRSLQGPPGQESALNLFALDSDEEVAQESFIGGLEALASMGYTGEAIALLEQATPGVRSAARAQSLELGLLATGALPELDERVRAQTADLTTSQSDMERRVNIATRLMLTGHHSLVRELMEPALTSADLIVSSQALAVLTSDALVRDKDDEIDGLVDQFVAANADRQQARDQAATLLYRLGFDKKASALARDTADRMPTPGNVIKAVELTQAEGSAEAFKQITARHWEVGDSPSADMSQRLRDSYRSLSPELARQLIIKLRIIYPASFQIRVIEMLVAYQAGDVARGREVALKILDDVEWDSMAVEVVLGQLLVRGLHAEVARVIGPKLPATRSVRSSLYLGISLATIHADAEADAALRDYVDRSPDPGAAATTLASELLDRRPDLALKWAEAGVRRNPARPHSRLVLGLSRVAAGQLTELDQDLKDGIVGGIGREEALRQLARVSLKVGASALALKAGELLIMQPASDQELIRGVDAMLDDYDRAGVPDKALGALETLLPDFAVGHGVLVDLSYPKLASAYESSGQPELAFALYERQIQRGLLLGDELGALTTNLNNLAYSYATTNQRIDAGLILVRRSLALSAVAAETARSTRSQDNHALIDTLGWLLYRKGDYAGAQAEIERSIRHARNASYSLDELYEHLAAILDARGKHREAGWMRVMIEHGGL